MLGDHGHMTFIEMLLEDDGAMEAVLEIPDSIGDQIVRKRRRNNFSMFWEELDLDKEFVLERSKNFEEMFIDEHGCPGIPDWIVRVEAQDVMMEYIHEGYKEEGLIE